MFAEISDHRALGWKLMLSMRDLQPFDAELYFRRKTQLYCIVVTFKQLILLLVVLFVILFVI